MSANLDNEYNTVVAALTKQSQRKRKKNAETALQKTIINELRGHALWVIRVPGQGVIQMTGAGVGVLKESEMRGFPDLLVIGPEGSTAWLEVKTETGRVSPAQKSVHKNLEYLGHTVAVVRTPQQAVDVLKAAGLIYCPLTIPELKKAAAKTA